MKLHACLTLGFIAVTASAGIAHAMGASSKAAPQILAAPPTPAPRPAPVAAASVAPASVVPASLAPAVVGSPPMARAPVGPAAGALPATTIEPAHEAPAPTIADLVARHAHDNGVPVGLANAVIRIESRFNPRASNRGALGLMQIRAGTARSYGFDGSASGLLTPDTNLRFSMKVLARAYRASSGNVCRTLAFYQSGHEVRRFNRAQRIYCSKARTYMAHA